MTGDTNQNTIEDEQRMNEEEFQIEEMDTKNTSFSLDQLGRQCSPLQYVRELTQNSIEAILGDSGEGDIFWTYDRDELEETGIHKLACIDSGPGMDGEELRNLMNRMYSSGKDQSVQGNFGIGAKVAGVYRSPKGLIYRSYKNGKGYLGELCRHPSSGKYGLRQQEEEDGSLTPYRQIPASSRPAQMKKGCGTMVTLIGKKEDEDTFTNHPEVVGGHDWLTKYLNGRYFKIPKGIEIRAQYSYKANQEIIAENPQKYVGQEMVNGNVYPKRTILGMQHYLGKYQNASGVVEVNGANMHWWVLNDGIRKLNYLTNLSHTGTLFQDEIHDLEVATKTNKSRLNRCGIIHLLNRMVIYAEPTNEGVFADPSRSEIFIAEGIKSPWTDWADEFFDNLPPEIAKLEDEASERASDGDINIQAYDMLKEWLKDHKVPKYISKDSGEIEITPLVDSGGVPESGITSETQNNKPDESREYTGSRGKRYSDFTTDDGKKGREVNSEQFIPRVDWISPEDQPHLDDRAAQYIRPHNRLLINEEYRGFTSWVDLVHAEKGGGKPGSRTIVEDACKLHWQVHLCETVMRVQMLKKDGKTWRMDEVDSALSELGLTTAVSGIGHLDKAVRNKVGHAIGIVVKRKDAELLVPY